MTPPMPPLADWHSPQKGQIRQSTATSVRVGGWWLVVGGLWFVVGGWWLVVGDWWLVIGGGWWWLALISEGAHGGGG